MGDDCGVRRRTKEEIGTKEELGMSDWVSVSTSLHCCVKRVGRAAFMLTSRSVLEWIRGEADEACLKSCQQCLFSRVDGRAYPMRYITL